LPVNGSPDLNRRPFLVGAFCELLAGEHRRAADTVPAGGGAVENNEVPGSARAGPSEELHRKKTDAHRVDQTVVLVRIVEGRLAANGRHPDAIAVLSDPGHSAAERPVRRAEPQAVEQRDRASAHRDDVAQDPADAGRCALERLDRARMVVALDFERDREPLADVDHAGVFAGSLQDTLARGGQPLEERRRMLVATVLGPEQREDRELEVIRLPAEQVADP
jgi:hypothetical protein